ncbi:PucR C-terminal helix-turn-helix domain-containing protein [Prauserella aidingensis]|uniref:GAF domain-containing protein n=1 Tax=Prauserella aidingensis TaxID=387890 RepID=UPI0020A41A64|nr:GAF domain-containing protein [Prauserella aidingensis]MCP2253770.1 PucR C-terminal helix-turn-helix domain-containing protein [Prauserella aidingensis]
MGDSTASALPPVSPADPAWPGSCAPDGGRRERDVIAAFSEITTEAITTTQLEGLLGLLGRKLCHLLGVMRCSVYLRRDDGRFRGAAGYCERDGDISAAVQAQEAGIQGDRFSREVIDTAAPVLISDVTSDPRPHRRTMEHWRVRAMLGVPLVFDDEVIGLVFVDNLDQEHAYTSDDVALAELFARLGALFLRQAMLNADLTRKAAEVARQKNTLAYFADVHRRLTGAVLDGASIQTVVELLGELSAKPVVLYNEDFRVLAWSAPEALKMDQPPVLSSRIRQIPSVRSTLAGLSADCPSAVVPPTPALGLGRRQLMCRLIIEGRPSGYLAIVEVGRGLERRDSKLAEHGATVLSLQVLSERRQTEAEGQAREDFLSDLLHRERDAEQLQRRGPQFGVNLSQPHVLVRFSLDSADQNVSVSAGRKLVGNQLARELSAPPPPAVSLPGAVIALVPLDEAGAPEDLRMAVAAVRNELAPRLNVRAAAISAVCRSPEDFPLAHRELREIDELARSFGWQGGVVTADELGLFRVIAATGRVKEAVHFAHEFIRPLRGSGDDTLIDTWRTFVTTEGKVQATATELGVHENTIRYRLGKIRKLVHRDPTGLDCLLQARFAFQILDLAGW